MWNTKTHIFSGEYEKKSDSKTPKANFLIACFNGE